MNKEPAILFLDIETTPTIFAGWRLGKQHVGHEQILKNPEVLCISWAFNDCKVQHDHLNLGLYDWYEKDDTADFEMLSRFVKVANEADLHVTQNGKGFDIPFLRSRILKYKLPDINPSILMDDTFLSTRKIIGLMSHKLDYMGDYLGHGRKEPHGNGMEWWIEIMRGNTKVLKNMIKYCDGDVIKTRKIYNDLKPYIRQKLNLSVYHDDPAICPDCGGRNTLKIHDKKRYTSAGYRTQFRCNQCGVYKTLGGNELQKSRWYPR